MKLNLNMETEQIIYVRPFSRILDINEIIEYRKYDQTRSCKIVYRSLLSEIKFYEKKLKTLGRGEYEAYKPRCYRKSPNDFLKFDDNKKIYQDFFQIAIPEANAAMLYLKALFDKWGGCRRYKYVDQD